MAAVRKCSVDGCDGKHRARGYCRPHYQRFKDYGDPLAGPPLRASWHAVDGRKRCRVCREVKSVDQFNRGNRNNRDGLRGDCKPCQHSYLQQWRDGRSDDAVERRRQYEKRQKARAAYGISPEEYDRLFADGGHCHICGSDGGGRWRRAHIDHDHVTGRVRGLLCHACNTALGLAGDDPERLRRMADYIERSRLEGGHEPHRLAG